MKDASKSIHRNEAIDNNNYIRVQIPVKIASHLNIKPGDTLAFQTEYSKKYANPYASLWNETKDGTLGEEKFSKAEEIHDAIFQTTPIECRAENCDGDLGPYILHVELHELKCSKCHREFVLETDEILSEGDQ